ncbi:MAG: MBL fold metallo-hydrolase [Alphaproteobacteria bacterium]|nr:MBL fold metallo-hydrolase [Alphaproteobacteria bacterium]MBU1512595.1 MBL fold metallo-hydrolase [Alphaproteobacteria bacterium]MBU2092934.1 MBL fold metallo-hydrolase [Alphaproteobacteria bacterium]MBU2150827.1 MBL fold metallo-hydrolase [Alphaproteobacteria bacterium]MBU2307961.1 MBL fold metallo-hydrolase [Alphaproteobacteria bacterium]
MLVRFWGTRGSLPVAQQAGAIQAKIAQALVAGSGRTFADVAEADAFARANLDFATYGAYGGATSCVEIEGADSAFLVCDMGSGLREFGIDSFRRIAGGHAPVYHFFLSHLHWDHIMGFPFFGPAFNPAATIVIHAGHEDAEIALRRQQEEISFPVPFDWLRAKFEFVVHKPGEPFEVDGVTVSLCAQHHSHDSYGYRFEREGRSVVYSTDSEHKIDTMDAEAAFEAFFANADLVICDTMYSLGDTVSLKQDWGHSSNIVAVDLCRAARAKTLALFHHEPTYTDQDIQRMHAETVRYEELVRADRPALEVICAYDGLEVAV